jgi:hypothetical protein
MTAPRLRREFPAAFGVLALTSVCMVALVATGTASANKKPGAPLIDIGGSSYTNVTDTTGQVVIAQTQFSMTAREARDGT